MKSNLKNYGLTNLRAVIFICMAILFTNCSNNISQNSSDSLLPEKILRDHVSYFNQMDEEGVVNYISNAESADWMVHNVPLFESPDSTLEQIYYFRWWTFRKHIKQTPAGFVLTEFIRPVGHDEIGRASCRARLERAGWQE